MAGRTCAGCAKPPRTPKSKWCSEVCRKTAARKPARQEDPPETPVCTNVSDALELELVALRMVDTYEGQVALGIARQLENGSVSGAAYASLSKELDRRVEVLRLKADLPDDPSREVASAVAQKRALLRAV